MEAEADMEGHKDILGRHFMTWDAILVVHLDVAGIDGELVFWA